MASPVLLTNDTGFRAFVWLNKVFQAETLVELDTAPDIYAETMRGGRPSVPGAAAHSEKPTSCTTYEDLDEAPRADPRSPLQPPPPPSAAPRLSQGTGDLPDLEDVVAPAVPADGEELEFLFVVPIDQVAPVDFARVVRRDLRALSGKKGPGREKKACRA